MAELYIKGWIVDDSNYNIGVTDKNPNNGELPIYPWEKGNSIIEMIESFALEYGIFGNHKKGLGGTRSYIDDCNLKIYFTDKESTLEEAMEAFDVLIYGGDIKTKMDRVGYSEYTIEGIDLKEFTIGGHNLKSEIESHYNEYMHFILEV